jgi:hypothetical protein
MLKKMSFNNLFKKHKSAFKIIRFNFCEQDKVNKDASFRNFLDTHATSDEFSFPKTNINLNFDYKKIIRRVILSDSTPSEFDTQMRNKFKNMDLEKLSEASLIDILKNLINDNLTNILNRKSGSLDPNKDKIFTHILSMIQDAEFTLKDKNKKSDDLTNLSNYF